MKNETWRQQPDAYPFRQPLLPRYVDLDTERHVNNVAVYQLHAEARLRFLLNVLGPQALFSDDVLLRPLTATTDYLRISHFPEPIESGMRLQGVNEHGYRLAVGLFQGGACVGVHDCVMAAWRQGERVPLPEAVRAALTAQETSEDGPQADAAPEAEHGYPLTVEITPRYADHDPDKVVGDAAVCRYVEQSRASAMNIIRTPEIGLLVASVQVRFLRYRTVRERVQVSVGVERIGNSSFVLQSRVIGDGQPLAVARSTMVVFDRAGGRPRPVTAAERERLQSLALRPA